MSCVALLCWESDIPVSMKCLLCDDGKEGGEGRPLLTLTSAYITKGLLVWVFDLIDYRIWCLGFVYFGVCRSLSIAWSFRYGPPEPRVSHHQILRRPGYPSSLCYLSLFTLYILFFKLCRTIIERDQNGLMSHVPNIMKTSESCRGLSRRG